MNNTTPDTNLAPVLCPGLFQNPLGYLASFPIRALILVLLPVWGVVVLGAALFMLTFGTIRKSS
jgi:hypothetical protein